MLEKTLESPLDCKEIQPVHPKISPEYSLEGLMLKLKLQYFGHLMKRTSRIELPFVALFIISPEYSLEGLILKLKLQYFGHLM